MKMPRTLAVLATLALLLGALAGPAAAQDALAASKALMTPRCNAMLHVDVKAMYPAVVKAVASDETLAADENIKTMLDALKDVDSIDVYAIIPSRDDQMPMPVVYGAVRGKMTAQKMGSVLSATPGGQGQQLQAVAIEGQPGRYQLAPSPFMLIDGNETDDVDAGVVMFAMGPILTTQMITSLGQADNAPVLALLKQADTKAPIWGAVDLIGTGQSDKNEPQTVVGSVDPRGKGKLTFTASFLTAEPAKDFTEALTGEEGPGMMLNELFAATQNDKAVTVSLKPGEQDLLPRTLAALTRARMLAKRAMSGAQLHGIGTGLVMYEVEFEAMPTTLDVLIEKDYINKKMLTSPSAEGTDIKQPHYIYIPLPETAPSSLIEVYEKPEINDNKGTNVLRANASVEWVDMETFKKDLAATEKWLAENK